MAGGAPPALVEQPGSFSAYYQSTDETVGGLPSYRQQHGTRPTPAETATTQSHDDLTKGKGLNQKQKPIESNTRKTMAQSGPWRAEPRNTASSN